MKKEKNYEILLIISIMIIMLIVLILIFSAVDKKMKEKEDKHEFIPLEEQLKIANKINDSLFIHNNIKQNNNGST